MILIISTKTGEATTCHVIDWLHYLKGNWRRLHGEELHENSVLSYQITDESTDIQLFIDEDVITLSDINSVWYRRGGFWSNLDFEQVERQGRDTLQKFCVNEMKEIKSAFFHTLTQKKCLTNPVDQREVNKPHILTIAKEAGLNIPPTIITGIKKELTKFYQEHGSAIVKPISNPDFFQIGGQMHMSYTEVIDEEFIEELPDKFTPCLAQKKIEKDIEIRIFVLDDEIYSMAIFSQNDQQTQVDFRRYNNDKPNRNVPYQLPTEIEEKIRIFMQKANLNNGSIDMIKSVTGEFIFLEINPVGQFGMVSQPCNYYLEKKVAQWLIKHDQ